MTNYIKDINLYMVEIKKEMILKFNDKGFYFSLISCSNLETGIKEFSDLDVGDYLNIFDDTKEVAEYFLTFATDKLTYGKYIDRYMEDIKRSNIPGKYTVPELDLKDVSFVDVLEAVKKYYSQKQDSHIKHKKAV